MNLSYQHVNPTNGGGSYLLRLRDGVSRNTACVLVDSGSGVDLDSVLGPDEYLAAVLLTHSHLDHYGTLADSLRDGAPVYASEATANVLEDVLTEGGKNYDLGATDDVLDALEPLSDWETVFPDVEVRPIPAGHAPGAAGFLVRFHDGNRANHLLFTGDFTTRRVAGYPGFPTDLPVGIDALFVNVSTAPEFEETLSDSLFTIVERARAGSSVLATASALTGVHYAYLLGHLGDRLGESLPVTLVGQTAKLYDDLGYDVPNVESVPTFADTEDLLKRGAVTLAGPEIPSEGSASRLFRTIENDATATLIQLTGGATDPVTTAACTVYDYEVVNHTSREVIDDLVTGFNPIHVVTGHGPSRVVREYRGRYDERFVWASTDDRPQTLYADGRWSSPPWLSESAVQAIRAQDWQSSGGRFGELVDGDLDVLPAVERIGDPDLEAEGLDVERFERRFGGRSDESATDARPTSPRASADGGAVASADGEAVPADGEAVPADDGTAALPDDEIAAASAAAISSDGEAFRREVLDRLDALDDAVGGRQVRARVVDGGDDVTLLRLLGDTDLEHGEELTVTLSADDE
ncbi:MBL fold metallo-hydrolase [Halorussus amylolyticus]|uniref:MBL fold metallo-hydrolase n=1 Tax=Halorussus amylolyticus TaxID=1126242 RepID=UPI0010439100|nr:MBL fold metallo-hydrolase [Halorussus amylolyticus]